MKKAHFILFMFLLISCTKEIAIEPEYTNETDWYPKITLLNYNYQRVELGIEKPPRLEIERNIESYVFEIKKYGEEEFIPVDTISMKQVRYLPEHYTSPQVLQQNEYYYFRMKVRYRNGVEQNSFSLSGASPIVRGKILRRIDLPGEFSDISFFPYDFGFGNGYLYASASIYGDDYPSQDNLVRIDTVSSEMRIIKQDFRPMHARNSSIYLDLETQADFAFVIESPMDDQTVVLLKKLYLNSGELSEIFSIPVPEGYSYNTYVKLLDYVGNTVLLVWIFEDKQLIYKIDHESGTVQDTISVSLGGLFYEAGAYACDGTNFWLARMKKFDNRFIKFDSSGTLLWPQHRNPVYSYQGLEWDGGHFWVYDREEKAFVQLELEGL